MAKAEYKPFGNSIFLLSVWCPMAHGLQLFPPIITSLNTTLDNIILYACLMKKFAISHFPRWFSGELRKLIIMEKITNKRFKWTLKCFHLFEYTNLRKACKFQSHECYLTTYPTVKQTPHLIPKFLVSGKGLKELLIYHPVYSSMKRKPRTPQVNNNFSTLTYALCTLLCHIVLLALTVSVPWQLVRSRDGIGTFQ